MRTSPLLPLHQARGAQMITIQGMQVPAVFSTVRREYQAIQEGVGCLDLSGRGVLRITGPDRKSWLQGLVSADIQKLRDGTACYSVMMNPQGQLLTDMRVYALPDALLIDLPPGTAATIPDHLDRFLIMEDAEIHNVSDDLALFSLQGPQAACVVSCVFGDEWERVPMWTAREATVEGHAVVIARVSRTGEDGFDLFVPAPAAVDVWTRLCTCRPHYLLELVGWEAFNTRRVEAGIPLWGFELDPSVVALEARLDHAISRSKGCYVGQEIIARVDARGKVNNQLAGLTLPGETLPPPASEIHVGDKRVGRTCTAVHSLRLDRNIALGYLRREHVTAGDAVIVRTPDGDLEAVVADLPFVPHDCSGG